MTWKVSTSAAHPRAMTHFLILGAGLNGLSTALLLARDGHRVTVVDRDPAPPEPGTEWDGWQRPGVAHFRFAHIMLPRWYTQMRTDLPEVLDEVTAAGGIALNMADLLPEPARGPRRPDDDRFDTVNACRPTLDAAFARVADRTPGVTVRHGVTVTGLEVDGRHVTGVRTRAGEVLHADLVVDCGGRRSALSAWLTAAGLRAPAEERQDAGFVYFGRHFRGRHPFAVQPLLQHHDSLSIITLPTDRDTWTAVFVASTRDHALRALRDPACWDAALALYPLAAPWRDGEPITGVDVMAGLADRCRSLLVDGEPVATGVVSVGDSAFCTNPSLGRGSSIGLLHARLLRDLLRETGPDERDKLVRQFAERTAATVEPLYRGTAWFDRHRIAEIDADVAGVPYRTDDERWTVARATYTAALTDPDAGRAQMTLGSLLATADEVLADRALVGRIMATAAGAPRYPLPGATRSELLAVLDR